MSAKFIRTSCSFSISIAKCCAALPAVIKIVFLSFLMCSFSTSKSTLSSGFSKDGMLIKSEATFMAGVIISNSPFIAFLSIIPTNNILLISFVPSYILAILASRYAASIGASEEYPMPP